METKHIAIKEAPAWTVTVNDRVMTITDGAMADDRRIGEMVDAIDEMMELIRMEVTLSLHKMLREKTGFNGPTTPSHVEKLFKQVKQDCKRAIEERRVTAIMMKEEQV